MFNEDSQIVKNQIILIDNNLKTFDEVQDIFNLREVVKSVLDKRKIESVEVFNETIKGGDENYEV